MVAHQEVLSELWDVHEALQASIHETCVTQILQTAKALDCPTSWDNLIEVFSDEHFHIEASLVLGGELSDLISNRFFGLLTLLSEDELSLLWCLNQEHILIDEVQIVNFELLLLICAADWDCIDSSVCKVQVALVNFVQILLLRVGSDPEAALHGHVTAITAHLMHIVVQTAEHFPFKLEYCLALGEVAEPRLFHLVDTLVWHRNKVDLAHLHFDLSFLIFRYTAITH